MRIAVLGPLEVVADDQEQVAISGSKERTLLAALAAVAPGAVSVDRLIDTLWKGREPPTARKSLQAHVVRLRSALEPVRPAGSTGRYVLRRGGGYVLSVNPDELDALAFPDLVARGRALLSGGDPAAARRQLEQALGLWRGEPYQDWSDEPFAEAERRRLSEIRASAVEAFLDADLALGRPGQVVAELERLVVDDPLREGWWTRLMLALYRDGRQGEALAAASRARAVLAEELGVDPGPELRALENAVLAQDPSLDLPGPARGEVRVLPQPESPSILATCPYKGLASYQTDDAAIFYGHNRLVTALVGRLVDTDVLVLSGPSGAGKSSIIRAGLVPALVAGVIPGSQHWPSHVVTPGTHPIDVLAPFTAETEDRNESGRAQSALLVVDQAEQLFGAEVDPGERHAFLDELLTLVDEGAMARAIVVIRGDYLARLAEHAAFAERVAGSLVLVPPLTADELREVVIEPARAVGLSVEPELADAVVADVLGRPGALPLLSTALVATWEHRRGELLTLSGYLEGGGVSGALGRTAEAAYNHLDTTGQTEARRILVRLADSAEGGALVSRRVSLAELDLDGPGGAARQSVIESFVARRLLAVDEGRLEVAHEALLTAWPRLASWLDDDAVGRRMRRHLAPAAHEWDARGRSEEELYRGARLTAALEWADTPAAALTATETDFLHASQRRADAELQEARDRATHESRARRRNRRFAIGLAGALVAALVAAGAALQARQTAQDQTAVAANARSVAEANRLAALSATAGTIDLSLLLAAEAVRVADTPETRDGLLGTLVEHARAVRVLPIPGRPREMALAGDGRTVFLSTDGGVFTVDLITGDAPRQILGAAPLEAWHFVTASPVEGLAAVSVSFTISGLPHPLLQIMDSNGEVKLSFDQAQLAGWPLDVAFSTDGERIIIALDRKLDPEDPTSSFGFVVGVIEIDLAARTIRDTGIEVRSPSPGESVIDAALSVDGSRIATWLVEEEPRPNLIELADGSRVDIKPLIRAGHIQHGFVPLPFGLVQRWDDGVLATYSEDGQVAQTVEAHDARVHAIAGTSDGRTAVSIGEDGRIVVWDATAGADGAEPSLSVVDVLTGHDGSVTGLALPGDGQTMLTGGMDGRLVQWDLSGEQGFGVPVEPLDGQVIANRPHLLGDSGIVVAPTRPQATLTEFQGLSVRDDTAVAATFLDAKTGAVIDDVPVGNTIAGSTIGSSVSVSPDGERVAVTSGFRTTLLDAASREILATLELPPTATDDLPMEMVWGSGWSADGSRLYLAAEGAMLGGDSLDGAVVVVSGHTLEMLGRIADGGDTQVVEVSPDGRWLAVGREESGDLVVLDESDHTVTVAELAPPLPDPLLDMSFSPDGRWLATGGVAGQLHIWNTADWSVAREGVPMHSDRLLQVEWLPDNRTVVSSGADGRVVLYDAERGLVRGRPLTATADGRRSRAYVVPDLSSELVVLAGPLPGRTYPLYPATWFAHACAVAGRDLTEAEWATYVPERPYRRTCDLDDAPGA